MKRTRKLLFISIAAILGTLFITVLLAFAFIPTYDGVILEVNKNRDTQAASIWVVEGSTGDIIHQSESEWREIYVYQGTVFDLPPYIPDNTIEELSPGQEVKIYFSGIVEESGPAGGKAYWITSESESE